MPQNAKPAVDSGGHREIVISAWKPLSKLHSRDGARWIGLPGRPYKAADGTETFARIVAFCDRGTADRFRDELLDALDQYLSGGAE